VMSDIASVPDSHRDLTERTIWVLSTIGSSGRPQSTAVWFMLDDDGVARTSLTMERQKAKNMVATPMATLFVSDANNPYRTLEIRGDVRVTDDPELTMMRRIVEYYGNDFDTFEATRDDRVMVELFPRRVRAQG
jgi:PPOX class probable F420-dependent enzyme